MTVNHLWEVLGDTNCGHPVGPVEFQGKKIAIDLSIWICEALTSPTLHKFHSLPVVYLVFSRAVALLKLGATPVFCIEGKKRRLHLSGDNHFSIKCCNNRPPEFIHAIKNCIELLTMLGCPFIEAEFEAEALCGQLSSKGLVDGVITNDGDCFLYGAQCVYTSFSVENLMSATVKAYYVENLRGNANVSNKTKKTIDLTRDDLIVFACFTGSDLVGKGVTAVGGSKVLRFLHECKKETSFSSLQVICSWKNNSNPQDMEQTTSIKMSRTCRRCFHPGDCRQHEKVGCNMCGTSKYQQCMVVSLSERFQKSMRERAMSSMAFANKDVIEAYLYPSSPVPNTTFRINNPKIEKMYSSDLILSGKNLQCSQSYAANVFAKLKVRYLLSQRQAHVESDIKSTMDPIPITIRKRLIYKGHPCYEVLWSIKGLSLEFLTCEWEHLIEASFPSHVSKFVIQERQVFQRTNHNKRIEMFTAIDKQSRRYTRKVTRFFGSKPDVNKDIDQKIYRRKRTQTDASLLLRFVSNKPEIPNMDLSIEQNTSRAKTKRFLSKESSGSSKDDTPSNNIITNTLSTSNNRTSRLDDMGNVTLSNPKLKISVHLGPSIQLSPIVKHL